MGLFDALTTAVSGLQAQSFAMQNISGNIANSQTTAYKGIETNFEDLIPGDSVPTRQIAGGVIANSRATNNVQGTIQSTTSTTDMAVNGNGFFVVQAPTGFNGNQPLFGGIDSYTRRGDFQLDANGYLVNGSGYFLEGIPIDPTTGNPVGSVATPLQFQGNFLPASATTQVNYGINLPSTPQTNSFVATTPNSELLNPTDFSAGHDPTVAGTGIVVGSDVSTFVNESIDGGSVTIYDPIGTPANLQLRWAKTDSVANGGADTWELFYQTDATATGTNPAWINAGTDFVFEVNGRMRDLIAHKVENQRLRLSLANHCDLNVSALGSFQGFGDEVGCHAVCRFSVDGRDDVAGANAGAKRRRTLIGRDDIDLVVLLLDDHSDAVVMAALVFAHLGVSLGIVEVRVWIEYAQHTGDCPVIDCRVCFVPMNGLCVVLFYESVHIRKRLEVIANLALILR